MTAVRESGNDDAGEKPRQTIDLQSVRAALAARRALLLGEASELTVDERALGESREAEGGPGSDSADVASDLAEQEVAEALEHNVRGQLFEVEQALKRLEDGRYGICVECGRLIDPARLKALPWARLCLDCQRHEERRGT